MVAARFGSASASFSCQCFYRARRTKTRVIKTSPHEDVQTSVGQLKAFRITHSFIHEGLTGRMDAGTVVLWYAPAARQYVWGEAGVKLRSGWVKFPSFKVVAVEPLR